MLRLQGVLMMIERLAIVLGICGLLAAATLTPVAAMICYIAAPALMAVVGAFVLRRYILARFSFDITFLRKLFAYSLPLLPFTLVGFFSGSYVDAVFIAQYLSTADLGVYWIATQVSGIALQLPTLANTLLLPLFISLNKESQDDRLENYFRNVLPSVTLVWGMACAIVAFACYFVIGPAFGPEFRPATVPVWVLLSASTVAIPMALGFSPISNATSRTHVAMFGAIAGAAANVAANAVLIPLYGLPGCAWATLISFVAFASVYALMLRAEMSIPTWQPMMAVIPAMLSAALLAALASPIWALAGCIIMSCVVGYFFKGSLRHARVFLRNRRWAA
jgi:O-antigen/teichoic acid export membrane protein